MNNCQKCGASTKFHDIDGFYDCGSVELGIIRQEFNQSPGCKELCQLRERLAFLERWREVVLDKVYWVAGRALVSVFVGAGSALTAEDFDAAVRKEMGK